MADKPFTACAVCFIQRGQRVKSTTTVKSYRVCDAHIGLASRDDFNISSLQTGGRHCV